MPFLSSGAHATSEQGVCAMEFVAWAAGEPHSDHPRCVDRKIASFVRTLNDIASDSERQRLLPHLLQTIGTNAMIAQQSRAVVTQIDETRQKLLEKAFASRAPGNYYDSGRTNLQFSSMAIQAAYAMISLDGSIRDEAFPLLKALCEVWSQSVVEPEFAPACT